MDMTLFVISDLHLGGRAGSKDASGFQMCSPKSQKLLADFIGRLPASTREHEVKLVIAGDIVDFLAEEPFEAFTSDEESAKKKLEKILDNTAPIWAALRAFLADRSGALTLLLGNHDIELSLPSVRKTFLKALGPGQVDFLYDNEALTIGPVLVEHGNRFDEWNAVPHGALRRVRSQLSRSLLVHPPFPPLPGSQLVTQVINRIKSHYPFVDLLKPENEAALPILAALGVGEIRDVWRFYQKYRQTFAVDFDEDHEPVNPEYIKAVSDDDQVAFVLAQQILDGGDSSQIGAISNALSGIACTVKAEVRQYVQNALFKVFRAMQASHQEAFDVGHEISKYLRPATVASKKFKVVIYGHTHHVKCVPLTEGEHTAIYLNTGTWADLMRVPEEVWSTDETRARSVLSSFVSDLESNDLDKWRCSVPTFAKVEMTDGSVTAAAVYFADGDWNEPVDTRRLLQRLKEHDGT